MESPENRAEALFWRAESAYSASIAPLQEDPEFELGEKRLLQLDQHYQTFLDEERKLNNQTSVQFLPITHFRRGFGTCEKPEDSLAAFQITLKPGMAIISPKFITDEVVFLTKEEITKKRSNHFWPIVKVRINPIVPKLNFGSGALREN